MYEFLFWFLMFLFLSFVGWVTETLYVSTKNKHYTTRGFLVGPYLPVYGVGAICMLIFLKKYLDDPITLFFMAIIVTSFIEYITGVVMEKLFNARWWDYSNQKFNINGRICLLNSIVFGVLGLFLLYIIEPNLTVLLRQIPENILIIVSSILLIAFVIDIVISFNIILKIKNNTRFIKKDSTDEITKKVRETLAKNAHLAKRILGAFPKFNPLDANISVATFKQALERLELENKQKRLMTKQTKQQIKNKIKSKQLEQKQKELKRKKL